MSDHPARMSKGLAWAGWGLFYLGLTWHSPCLASTRPLPPATVREVPRTVTEIRRDLRKTGQALQEDRRNLERAARKWARSPDSGPESEWALRVQGLREAMVRSLSRQVGLEEELAEAISDKGDTDSARLRLRIARQSSVVEDARYRLTLARSAEDLALAEVNLDEALGELDRLRAEYWRTRPPARR